MFLKIFLTLFCVHFCCGVIHELDNVEYNRMPRLFGLDDYDGCLNSENGLYCAMQLDLYAGDNQDLYHMIQEYSKFEQQHYNHSFIDRGVCVTKKCKQYLKNTTADLEWILGECLNNSIYREYGLEAKVSRFYCDRPNEETVIDTSDWIVAGIIGFIILMNIVGSFYHYFIRRTNKKENEKSKNDEVGAVKVVENKGNPFLLCFSVQKNWKWLVYQTEDPQMEKFKGLFGIRVIIMLLVVMTHTIFVYGIYIDNEHFSEKEMPKYWMVVNGAIVIQLFFVMSGMLLAYKMEMSTEKAPVPWSMVPKIILFRWLRLTPSYALMIAFGATWMRHVYSGPVWKIIVTETMAADCRQYWWHHILYFHNYIGDGGKHCAAQSWYIPADMQLFALGVIVLVATQTRGRSLVLLIMIAIGVIAPAVQVWKDGLPGAMLFTPALLRSLDNETFYHLHILSHNNMPAFAVGIAVAILLFKWQKSKKDFKEYKKYLKYLTSLGLALAFLVIYIGSVLFFTTDEPPLWIRMAYQGLHRFIFSLCVAMIFIGLALKCDDTLRRLFEWDGWVVPGRLCYSVYILHMLFVNFINGSKTQLIHMNTFNLMITYLGLVCVLFLAAVPFSLTVEAPMIALGDILRKRRK